MTYLEYKSFKKDLKDLLKRFRTLNEDLETAKQNALELFHIQGVDNGSVFPLQEFCSDNLKIFKLKKFACKALKGRGVKSGIRVIYAFHETKKTIEFIEIYFKADQDLESKDRIRDYLASIPTK